MISAEKDRWRKVQGGHHVGFWIVILPGLLNDAKEQVWMDTAQFIYTKAVFDKAPGLAHQYDQIGYLLGTRVACVASIFQASSAFKNAGGPRCVGDGEEGVDNPGSASRR